MGPTVAGPVQDLLAVLPLNNIHTFGLPKGIYKTENSLKMKHFFIFVQSGHGTLYTRERYGTVCAVANLF